MLSALHGETVAPDALCSFSAVPTFDIVAGLFQI